MRAYNLYSLFLWKIQGRNFSLHNDLPRAFVTLIGRLDMYVQLIIDNLCFFRINGAFEFDRGIFSNGVVEKKNKQIKQDRRIIQARMVGAGISLSGEAEAEFVLLII